MMEVIDNLKQKQMELKTGLAGVGKEVKTDEKSSVVGGDMMLALPVR